MMTLEKLTAQFLNDDKAITTVHVYLDGSVLVNSDVLGGVDLSADALDLIQHLSITALNFAEDDEIG